jgi:hypothetical protein
MASFDQFREEGPSVVTSAQDIDEYGCVEEQDHLAGFLVRFAAEVRPSFWRRSFLTQAPVP